MSIQITTLPNGLRVASESMPYLETASVGIWFDVGTRDESPDQNGIAHLLEHMLFKGTKRRNALQIAEEIESVGGHTNAYTARDFTSYYARVMHADLPLAVDLLADMVQYSTFDATEMGREQQVIVQEIHQSLETPDDVIFDYAQTAAYGKNPLGRSILGEVDVIQSLAPNHLRDYAGRHYLAPLTVIAAAGKVDHDQLVDMVGNQFTSLPKGQKPSVAASPYAPKPVLVKKDMEQTHVALSLPSCGVLSDGHYAASIYSTLLGGSSSSRLFQEIREKRGLAYSVSASLSTVDDSGLMVIYGAVASEQTAEFLKIVRDQLHQTAHHITDAELARAKQQLKAGLLMGLEQPFARAEQMAQHLLTFGRIIDVSEILQKVDAVDADQIKRLVRDMLGHPPAMAAIGSVKSLDVVGGFSLLSS